jgi:hypothetical protein
MWVAAGVGALICALGAGYIATNTYTASPGFVTRDAAEEFAENMPTCYGWSILLNREATYADAPGQSICIGYLRR